MNVDANIKKANMAIARAALSEANALDALASALLRNHMVDSKEDALEVLRRRFLR